LNFLKIVKFFSRLLRGDRFFTPLHISNADLFIVIYNKIILSNFFKIIKIYTSFSLNAAAQVMYFNVNLINLLNRKKTTPIWVAHRRRQEDWPQDATRISRAAEEYCTARGLPQLALRGAAQILRAAEEYCTARGLPQLALWGAAARGLPQLALWGAAARVLPQLALWGKAQIPRAAK
jgi:hypothetical protein